MAAIFINDGNTDPGAPVGANVANDGFLKALADDPAHGPLQLYSFDAVTVDSVRGHLNLAADCEIELIRHPGFDRLAEIGCLHQGQPNIYRTAWQRQSSNAGGFSITGLVHTLGPPSMLNVMAQTLTAPVYDWDALICTSTAAHAVLSDYLDHWTDHLSGRFGKGEIPRPQLPIIPLGIDVDAQKATDADHAGATDLKRELGIGGDDIAVLWVGRLSFFEKAHPFAAFAALEHAARSTGRKIHYLMAGWYPEAGHQQQYEELARAIAPSVQVHTLDGGDENTRRAAWATADIFLSLVDNIQETFGIAPVEAMAAGVPVVVSDWDGYRDTIVHGETGFLIPTIVPPAGAGRLLAEKNGWGQVSYQQYAGAVSQAVAVDTRKAADALTDLISNPDLRDRIGKAGAARAKAVYDWPNITPQYRALWSELSERRRSELEPARHQPWQRDPFELFAPFATSVIDDEHKIHTSDSFSKTRVKQLRDFEINTFAPIICSPEWADALATILEKTSGIKVSEAKDRFPPELHERFYLALSWFLKYDLIEIKPSD